MKLPMDVSDLVKKLAVDEATDRAIYLKLAGFERDQKLRGLFLKLAEEEMEHYKLWISILGVREAYPRRLKVAVYLLLRRLFGTTFAVKVLERGEHEAIQKYKEVLSGGIVPEDKRVEIEKVIGDELGHEEALLGSVKDERVRYMGSAVLGLNDALVELTGGLAGLASAISSSVLIGFSGLVVGIAAALSMAASNYLSLGVTEQGELSPSKAAAYTGVSYLLTVLLLVAPFFALTDRFAALAFSLTSAVFVIAAFSYYSSVVFNRPFRRSFLRMLMLGLGIAATTYLIGMALNVYLGIGV